jgi:hypothetical protein
MSNVNPFYFPLTTALLRSYEAGDSSIRQDVFAVCEAVEYADPEVELGWSESKDVWYTPLDAAQRLLTKTITRQARQHWH